MIKNTFYNLPEEKRQRITDAIFNEFSGSSGERVSINNIIKNANISRGSFISTLTIRLTLWRL